MNTTKALSKHLTLLAAAAWLLSGALMTEAQGRSGGQGRGGQPGQGKPVASQPRGGGQAGAGQQGMGRGAQDRDRIHLTDQQRDRFRDLSGAADQVRSRSRDLAKSTSGTGFNVTDLRRQRDQLHEQVRTLLRQHEELMNGFGAADHQRLQDRSRKLGQARDRMQTCLGNLDGMLGRGNLDGARLHREAREMERAAKQWQKQYRKLGEELGVG